MLFHGVKYGFSFTYKSQYFTDIYVINSPFISILHYRVFCWRFCTNVTFSFQWHTIIVCCFCGGNHFHKNLWRSVVVWCQFICMGLILHPPFVMIPNFQSRIFSVILIYSVINVWFQSIVIAYEHFKTRIAWNKDIGPFSGFANIIFFYILVNSSLEWDTFHCEWHNDWNRS